MLRLILNAILLLILKSFWVHGDFQNFIDLGYSVSEETIFFPGQREFELFKDHTPSGNDSGE